MSVRSQILEKRERITKNGTGEKVSHFPSRSMHTELENLARQTGNSLPAPFTERVAPRACFVSRLDNIHPHSLFSNISFLWLTSSHELRLNCYQS